MQALIDTHIHFDDDRFDEDRDAVYHNARNNGVNAMVVPATTRARWENLFSICSQFDNVFPTIGLHPVFVEQHQPVHLDNLVETLANQPCVAIGECGLDGSDKALDFEKQKFYFERQITIAREHNLALIIHARNAVEDVIQTIRTHGADTTGVVHSYNGSLEQAKQLIDLGYYMSFGGAVTYDRATRLRKMLTSVPLDSIMLETDAPDQPDSLHSGQRNQPSYLPAITSEIAKIKNTSAAVIAKHSNQNAQRLFKLPELIV